MSSGNGIRGRRSGSPGARVRPSSPILLALVLALSVPGWASAGTVSLAWDPVAETDLAGYRVYYGLSPQAMTGVSEVGLATEATVAGLADCTTWYLTVLAFDDTGLESAEQSNLVAGWPRPVITSVFPSTIRPGESALVTVLGTNFDPGAPGDPTHPGALVELSHAGLAVREILHDACGQLRVRVEAAPDALAGWSALTVKNVDVSWPDPLVHPRVFGAIAQAIEVLASESDEPPQVASSSPAAGQSGVPIDARPVVLFSESVDPSSVTSLTVRLLDAGGAAVPQAPGSPATSGAEVTIFPAQSLDDDASYRIEVRGGPTGVKDLSGTPMATTWRLDPAFRTAVDESPPLGTASVTDSSPAAGSTGVGLALDTVRVSFDRDMRGLASVLTPAMLQSKIGVYANGKKPLAQASGSPAFENDGRTIAIRLREPLSAGVSYVTRVNLTGKKVRKALEQAGHGELVLSRTWETPSPWKTIEALSAAEVRDMALDDGLPLVIGGNAPSAQNSGVPLDAEFRLTFAEPVAVRSVTSSTLRIMKGSKVIALAGQPQFEDEGRTIVIRAAGLQPGKKYKLQVRTGRTGVMLEPVGGLFVPIGAPRKLNVHFATEVSAATLSQSLGVGE